jgi:hypothetical protein
MGAIISAIIKYSFYTGVIGASAITLFLLQTLPSDESFHIYFSANKTSWKKYITTKTVSQPYFQSYVLVKTAEISTSETDKRMWIGIANNWIPMSK